MISGLKSITFLMDCGISDSLILQHIHKGAVVNAVHAQGADKKAFHQPERLSQ